MPVMNSVLTGNSTFTCSNAQISVELHACSEKTPRWPDILLWFTRRTASGSLKGDESLWKRLTGPSAVCVCVAADPQYNCYQPPVGFESSKYFLSTLVARWIFIRAPAGAESTCNVAVLLFWSLGMKTQTLTVRLKALIFQQKSNEDSQCMRWAATYYFDSNWYLITLGAIKSIFSFCSAPCSTN